MDEETALRVLRRVSMAWANHLRKLDDENEAEGGTRIHTLTVAEIEEADRTFGLTD